MRAKENKRKHRAAGNTVARIWALAPRPAAQTYTFAPPRGSSRRHRRIRLHRFKGFSRHRRICLHRFIGARGADVYASTASREPAPAAYTSTLAPFQGSSRHRRIRLHRVAGPPRHRRIRLHQFMRASRLRRIRLHCFTGALRHKRIRLHRLAGACGTDVHDSTASRDLRASRRGKPYAMLCYETQAGKHDPSKRSSESNFLELRKAVRKVASVRRAASG